MGKYYCPHCGADLDDQDGFDEKALYHHCTECGQLLISPFVDHRATKSGIIWFCDCCGECLNEQIGFDEDYSEWECTNCGHNNLIDNDHVFSSQKEWERKRIKYHCPSCYSLLNSQPSFYEDEEYTCENCGVDIIKGSFDYEVKYYCPKCGEVLNSQYSFNKYSDTHECDNCRTELYKCDNVFKVLYKCPNCDSNLSEQYGFDEDSVWECRYCDHNLYKDGDEYKLLYRCPNCGDILNNQYGFDEDEEWECTNCDYNLIKEDNQYVEVDEDDISYDDTDSYDEDDSYSDSHSDNYTESYNSSDSYEYTNINTRNDEDPKDNYSYQSLNRDKANRVKSNKSVKTKKQKAKKTSIKSILNTICFFLVIGALLYVSQFINDIKKQTLVGYSSSDLIGLQYSDVSRKLKKNGFTNIDTIPNYDLSYEFLDEKGEVYKILFGKDTEFYADNKYPYDKKVTVYYHTAKKNKIPKSKKQFKGMDYLEAIQLLNDEGFKNIETERMDDLILGWLNKEGAIETISVGGHSDYDVDEEYSIDVQIHITYHSFKE